MALTLKDLAASALAVVMALFAYYYEKGFNFPLITGYRGAILVLLVLGVGMCALSPASASNYSNPWIIVVATLGIVALVLIIAGLIFGTKTLFLAVTGIILTIWAIASVRHLIGG